jgi:hypothetical protein
MALRQDDTLFLASDGGARDKKASFGAVMATEDTILVECGGRAEGADPGSFRAEGYGILAILPVPTSSSTVLLRGQESPATPPAVL